MRRAFAQLAAAVTMIAATAAAATAWAFAPLGVSSPAFAGGRLGVAQACRAQGGAGLSPPLTISNLPKGTESIAIVMDDRDAPSGTWVHWNVVHIPPTAATIPEGHLPEGAVVGRTSGGHEGYEGACPPDGHHTYALSVYALSRRLDDVKTPITRADFEHLYADDIIAEGTLVGRF